MSYQVLARKWRPQNFKEMVGQQHVLRGLINALDSDRLHHAYLFTGTRGVGKTTVARILAKCLNCETGITSEPCGTCGACQEIASGRFIDLIEVDAASRTKVEDTRELLDNVQYAPTHGRFKVYLIDEVHMLSGHSFNALLKTLEEPPAHVKFLFATTDPQKLPVTILSRCLQFNLKRMTLDMISGHLKHLLQAENIPGDDDSVRLLSRAADGSMRDALSLMDQAVAFGNGSLVLSDVQEMLGSIAHDPLIALIKMIAAGDGAGIIAKVEDMAGITPDFAAATDALIAMLHQLAVLQVVNGADEDDDNLRDLAKHLSKEDVQLYYQIAINGRRDLSLAPDPRSGFEMLLLRMLAFRPTVVAPMGETEGVGKAEVIRSTPTHGSITEAALSDDQELKKKTIASQTDTGTSLPAPAPAPENRKSLDQDHSDEDEAPLAWDEYDQMVNKASALSPIIEPQADVLNDEVGNGQGVELGSEAEEEAPPWNLSDTPQVANAVQQQCSTREESAPSSVDNTNKGAPESASIADLLFADFPDDMGDDALVLKEEPIEAPTNISALTSSEPNSIHRNGLAEAEKSENRDHEGSLASVAAADTRAIQPKEPAPLVLSDDADEWCKVIGELSISGLASELAKNCILAHKSVDKIELHLDVSSEMLMTNSAINEIESALNTYFGQERKLVVAIRELTLETPAQYSLRCHQEMQVDAEQYIKNDSFVRQLTDRFAARVVPGSVKPKA